MGDNEKHALLESGSPVNTLPFADEEQAEQRIHQEVLQSLNQESLLQNSAAGSKDEQGQTRTGSAVEQLDDLERQELAMAQKPGAEEKNAENRLRNEIHRQLGVGLDSNVQKVLLAKDNNLADPNWGVQKPTPVTNFVRKDTSAMHQKVDE